MRINDLDLTYLKYFYSVAKVGGFSKASKELGVQQPSITRGVKNLEEQLGILLFERSGKSISLTTTGREILSACERIFSEAQNIKLIADSEMKECRGPLKFAVTNPISTFLIPKVLERYLSHHPAVWPQMFSGSAGELLSQVSKSELEFGVFFYLPPLMAGLQKSILSKVRFHLVIGGKVKSNESIKAKFIGSREIEDPNNHRFPTLERLRKDVPHAALAISTNDISAHKELVLKGLGVSILPHFMISEELKKGLLIDLYPKEESRFNLMLVTRKGAVLSHRAMAFLEVLKREIVI